MVEAVTVNDVAEDLVERTEVVEGVTGGVAVVGSTVVWALKTSQGPHEKELELTIMCIMYFSYPISLTIVYVVRDLEPGVRDVEL